MRAIPPASGAQFTELARSRPASWALDRQLLLEGKILHFHVFNRRINPVGKMVTIAHTLGKAIVRLSEALLDSIDSGKSRLNFQWHATPLNVDGKHLYNLVFPCHRH